MTEPAGVTGSFRLQMPGDFNFWNTVTSHGWYDLPPFTCHPESRVLGLILGLGDGTLVFCSMREVRGAVAVAFRANRMLDPPGRRVLRRQLRSCLRMDEDLTGFHAVARREPRFRWIARQRSGRLLRAPTLFEDVVKMICTTNCTWALTRQMVRGIVGELGILMEGSGRAFPAPEAIAGSSERTLRTRCSTGYRAPFILRLAEEVASGRRNLEALRGASIPSAELFAALREINGVGPYAAGNLLKLLGRYDYLGLDSWVRTRYADLHHRGRRVTDSTIERAYARWGEWRGLFFWCEMTRHWHDDKFGG